MTSRFVLYGAAAAAVSALGCAPSTPARPAASEHALFIVHDRSEEQTCLGRPRAEELVCRADRRLMGAREREDSSATRCYDARNKELRAVHRRIADRHDRNASEDHVDPELASARRRAAEQSLERIFASLEACEKKSLPADSVEAHAPSTGEEDVFATKPF